MASMEEADAPEPEAALRAERDALRAERDLLQQRLRDAHVKEQLLLTRVAELEAKYEPGVERSPNFRAAFAPSPFAGPEQRQPPVECVFAEAGGLGLKLNDVDGRVKVVQVNKGTQAERHPQTVGLLLLSVADTDVRGMEYQSVLSLLKGKKEERPLTLRFEQPAAAAAAPAPAPAPKPGKSKKPAKGGKGGGDEADFESRRRRYSVNHPDFSPAARTSSPAAPAVAAAPKQKAKVSRRTSVALAAHPDFAAAAAAAAVEEEEDSEEDEMPVQPGQELVECVFTEAGSLGLKLNDVDGRVKVVAVNKGTQGERHPQTVGLLLQSVGGTDVRGMPYQGVLGLLKEKKEERPLTLHFEQSR